MPPRLADRPDAVDIDGMWMYYCEGPGHSEPTLLPKDQFYFIRRPVQNGLYGETYLYRRRLCKHCIYVKRQSDWNTPTQDGARQYQHHGRVPLERMQKYLEELEARCGGANAAARRLGHVSGQAYLRWMGRTKDPGRANRWMMKDTALRVLLTLREVRAETRYQEIRFVPSGREDRCAGCGTHLENYTTGCENCMWRKAARGKRLSPVG